MSKLRARKAGILLPVHPRRPFVITAPAGVFFFVKALKKIPAYAGMTRWAGRGGLVCDEVSLKCFV